MAAGGDSKNSSSTTTKRNAYSQQQQQKKSALPPAAAYVPPILSQGRTRTVAERVKFIPPSKERLERVKKQAHHKVCK